jgi:DNA-directed RNA polymerase subunit RPC12/RpoP
VSELKIGKRYHCPQCSAQVLVVKPSSSATLRCCDREMELEPPKSVPASD